MRAKGGHEETESLKNSTVGRVIFNEALPEELRFRPGISDGRMARPALRRLMSECYRLYGPEKTAEVADTIKQLGFEYATKGGLSISVVDVVVPERKADILDDAGGRLVWLNFWAVSCEPCRTEMPAMQRLADEYADELLVLGVNWGEERGTVTDFVERLGIEYPVLLDPGLDTFYAWAATDGLPRHVFIGAEGTILREVVGPLDPARMVTIVEELLRTS